MVHTPGSGQSAAGAAAENPELPLFAAEHFLLFFTVLRATCLRHSAVESPLLKFTTVNINEKSSLLHSVQYIYRLFLENRIPSNTSIDISIDLHCFRTLGPPGSQVLSRCFQMLP